ncbi:MAG: CotS family spore coat protein [Solirubrobacterales bacterium]
MEEESRIKMVMDQYGLNIVSIEKVRSAYKIGTDNGTVCVKKINHGKNKARNGEKLVSELRKTGFKNTAEYYRTKDNMSFVRTKNSLYYVTEWIDGEECNLDDFNEVCKCAALLAKFHNAANNIDTKDLRIRNNIKNWPKIFNSNQYELERFKIKIEGKRLKTEFDKLYYEHIDSFINRGMVALNFLNTSDYYRISREADKRKTICHDSFYYQNLIKKKDEYFIIDLDSIIFDLHINDLGKFIRRLMFKSNYRWNFEYAQKIINSYCKVRKLSKGELEVMLALIVYPHKFWKLGKKRYVKFKNWDESKFMHKLSRLTKYDDLEQKFLEDYLIFLEGFS